MSFVFYKNMRNVQTLIVYSLLNDSLYRGDEGGFRRKMQRCLSDGQTPPLRLLLHHEHHFPDMRTGIEHPVCFARLCQRKGFKDLRFHRPGFN